MDSRNPLCELPNFDAAEKLTQKDFDDILNKIGPRTYTLSIPGRFTAEKARIFVVGCQGSGSEWQKKVADLMNQEASKAEPLITIVLGDNIYNTGASSPVDKKFRTQFFDMNYPGPCFVLIGNHDGNYDKKSAYANRYASYTMGAVRQLVGWAVEKYEVLVSYLPTASHSVSEQINQFLQPVLERDQLAAWNMPYVYFSLIVGEKEFFFVNSNSIFIDYLSFHDKLDKKEVIDPAKNQMAWLKQQYAASVAAGRMPILVSHHPADLTLGKRMTSFDAWHYATDEQLAELNKRLSIDPATKSFTELFNRLLAQEALTFHFKMSAHDHYINYVNDPAKTICQLTMGAGGGALHPFLKFNHPKSGCQIEQYGFATLSVPLESKTENDKIIGIDIHTIDGLHLKFDTKNHMPLRWEGSEEFEMLRQTVMMLSTEYFEALKLPVKEGASSSIGFFGRSMKLVSDGLVAANQVYEHMTKKSTHKNEPGVVQDIVAYFNQYDPPSIDEATDFLRKKVEDLKQFLPETDHSFVAYLRKELPSLFIEMQPSVNFGPTLSASKVVFDE